MTLYDITVPVHSGMFVYPGNPEVDCQLVQNLDAGDGCNLSRLDLGVHTGTHVDAPVHFLAGAGGVDRIQVDWMLGDAYVVDASSVEGEIDAAFLVAASIPTNAGRILFKTRNSDLWSRSAFTADYVGLAPGAAQMLVEKNVKLVGIDYLSIATAAHSRETHFILLAAGAVILEGLNLSKVPAGWYELLWLPIRLVGADGAPARAILRDVST